MDRNQENNKFIDESSPKSDQSNFSEEDIILPEQEDSCLAENCTSPSSTRDILYAESLEANLNLPIPDSNDFPRMSYFPSFSNPDPGSLELFIPGPIMSPESIRRKLTSSRFEEEEANVFTEYLHLSSVELGLAINFEELIRSRRAEMDQSVNSSPEQEILEVSDSELGASACSNVKQEADNCSKSEHGVIISSGFGQELSKSSNLGYKLPSISNLQDDLSLNSGHVASESSPSQQETLRNTNSGLETSSNLNVSALHCLTSEISNAESPERNLIVSTQDSYDIPNMTYPSRSSNNDHNSFEMFVPGRPIMSPESIKRKLTSARFEPEEASVYADFLHRSSVELGLAINFEEIIRARRAEFDQTANSVQEIDDLTVSNFELGASKSSNFEHEVSDCLSEGLLASSNSGFEVPGTTNSEQDEIKNSSLETPENSKLKSFENINSGHEDSNNSNINHEKLESLSLESEGPVNSSSEHEASVSYEHASSSILSREPRNIFLQPPQGTSVGFPLPPVPIISEFTRCVKEDFPVLFNERSALRDSYGIGQLPDMILLDIYRNRVERQWATHRAVYATHQMTDWLFQELMRSVTDLVERNRIHGINLAYEGVGSERRLHPATLRDMVELELAALVLGYTFLAFAQRMERDVLRRLDQLDAAEDSDRQQKIFCYKSEMEQLRAFIQDLSKTISSLSQLVNIPDKRNNNSRKDRK